MSLVKHYLSGEVLGMRLDCALARVSGISRSMAAALIKQKRVLIGETVNVTPSFRVRREEEVLIMPNITPAKVEPKFHLLYEDEHTLVVNKPAGLSVYRGAGKEENTLADQLVNKSQSSFRGGGRLGIVHRLDKDTSGALLVAKSSWAHMQLEEQIKSGHVERKYLALIWGVPRGGSIETHLKKSKAKFGTIEVCSKSEGRLAITSYKTIACSKYASLVECLLHTGRTHQIRVHMAHIGHPVVGDKLYGRDSRRAKRSLKRDQLQGALAFNRQALHAYRLSFKDLITGEKASVVSKVPDDMVELSSLLECSRP